MVQFDNKNGLIRIKVVYFGPALGGKTTCLRSIQRTLDPERRTVLYSFKNAGDRTLFLDLMSLNLGRIRGYSLTTRLYTVPGQAQNAATQKTVLAGADGVVFVADSHPGSRQQNLQSLEDLWGLVEANGLSRKDLPLVFQFNKRDLEQTVAVSDLEETLNLEGRPSFPTAALTGAGVMEALSKVCEDTLRSVAGRLGMGSNKTAIDRLIDQTRTTLAPFVGREDEALEAGSDFEVSISAEEDFSDQLREADHLVEAAIRADMVVTEPGVTVEELNRRLEEQIEFQTKILRKQREDLEQQSLQEQERMRDLDTRCRALSDSQAVLGQVITRAAAAAETGVAADRVTDLIRKAADLVPLLMAGNPLTLKEEGVSQLISRAVEPCGELARKKGVEVVTSVFEGIGEVVCDGASVGRALGAIVENAVQFSSRGGTVTLEVLKLTRDGRPWTVFRIADTGDGMPEHEASRVFEPFWRGQYTAKDRPLGLGLGLTAARMVMLRHGGTVTLSSRKGQGTEVMLGLPEEQPTPESRPVATGSTP